jgi:ankyrin repeat protein
LLSRGLVDANACLRLPRFREPPALVRAADYGLTEILDTLLRAGARIGDSDKKGQTACHVAAARGHADVLALLLAMTDDEVWSADDII